MDEFKYISTILLLKRIPTELQMAALIPDEVYDAMKKKLIVMRTGDYSV
jgi:hypothetical protein